MLNTLKENLKNSAPVFQNHMILSKIQPHTRPVEHLQECCSGVITAQYYFCARYFDLIEEEKAADIICELKKLQNVDKNTNQFGCMRWYREETFISDSNGAFFVLLPIALTYKLCAEKLSSREKADIIEMLENAAVWFRHTTDGALYYCNKIMSDGAMMALIANLTGKHIEDCNHFWLRWHSYVDTNGWGWGENSSDVYSKIMLNALNVTILASSNELREKAEQKREKLIDYIAFHNGREFIPTIRTYNFDAKVNYGGSIYQTFNTDGKDITDYEHIMNAIIILESGAKWPSEANRKNFRKERLFGNSYACTWKGDQIALGSVSHFPVMPFSYQNETIGADGKRSTHGLGWQSMPVSAMLEDKVGFLRIRSRINEKEYSHPAVNKHNAFLYNRLFEDGNITVFSTIAAQENNLAVVVRYANRLANTASGLWDEWCMPGDDNVIRETVISDAKWYIIMHGKESIALCPLSGIAYGQMGRTPMKTSVMQNGGFQTISTEFYAGETKLLFAPRLESAWVIVAFAQEESAEEYLKKISISDESMRTCEISQPAPYTRRKITCSDGKNHAELLIDPAMQIDF